VASDELNLSSLSPAQARKERKRIGRGQGSGKGRYSGRGLKGQKARSGSAKMRAGFEGGQMPLHMRLPKQRGNTSKDAMPVRPFMTSTVPVNVKDLEARFEAGGEVTPEALVRVRLIKNTKTDVKILGVGDLSKKLTVSAHGFSASAREKIEAAGGSVSYLRGDPALMKVRSSRKKRKKKAPPVGETAAAKTKAAKQPVGDKGPEEGVSGKPGGASDASERPEAPESED
jgi:large subunit ribosomal protein L15